MCLALTDETNALFLVLASPMAEPPAAFLVSILVLISATLASFVPPMGMPVWGSMHEVLLGASKTTEGNLTMGGGEQGQQGHEQGEEAGHCCWECVLEVEKEEV